MDLLQPDSPHPDPPGDRLPQVQARNRPPGVQPSRGVSADTSRLGGPRGPVGLLQLQLCHGRRCGLFLLHLQYGGSSLVSESDQLCQRGHVAGLCRGRSAGSTARVFRWGVLVLLSCCDSHLCLHSTDNLPFPAHA